ncbi:hypothetical protein Tco_0336329 [Tanacetum coccineum]
MVKVYACQLGWDGAWISKDVDLVNFGIDREDLETFWKLVKAKYENTRPEDDYERVLWGDLKVMFELDIKSDVWRNLQGYKIFLDYWVTLGFGSMDGLDLACPINRLPCHDEIQLVLGRITNSLPGLGLITATWITYLPDDSGLIQNRKEYILGLKAFFKLLLLKDIDQDSVHMVAASKVPMLKPGEFEIERMRIEQYIQMIDYALWEVIENGNSTPKSTVVEGVEKIIPPTTAEEKA